MKAKEARNWWKEEKGCVRKSFEWIVDDQRGSKLYSVKKAMVNMIETWNYRMNSEKWNRYDMYI